MPHTENRKRSIAKTLSWRVIATMLTLFVIWAVTKKLVLSLESTFIIATLNTVGYYFHERAWNRSSWGRIDGS